MKTFIKNVLALLLWSAKKCESQEVKAPKRSRLHQVSQNRKERQVGKPRTTAKKPAVAAKKTTKRVTKK